GLVLAKKYENEKNTDVLNAIAELYANFGTSDNNDFFINSEPKFTGYSKIGFIRQYSTFIKKIDIDDITYSGAELFKGIANKWVMSYAKKAIKDLATIYEDRAMSYSQKLKKLKSGKTTVEETQNLEKEIASSKAKQQKILEVYNGIR